MQTNITINQILMHQNETNANKKSAALMNDSMEDMLNRELILQNQRTLDAAKKKRSANSLTAKIYHADDRHMVKGKVAFKPLAMETVVENAAENEVNSKSKTIKTRPMVKHLLENAKKNMSLEKLHQPRTTE